MIDVAEIKQYRALCKVRKQRSMDMRAWEARNPNHKVYRVVGYKKTWQAIMLDNCRGRAKRKGVPCTITVESIIRGDKCPCCGIAFERGTGVRCKASPSLDRIRPELGYVPGNIEIICGRCNSIKNDASPEELRRVADWLESRRKHQ